jgi:hypothetical protein
MGGRKNLLGTPRIALRTLKMVKKYPTEEQVNIYFYIHVKKYIFWIKASCHERKVC